MVKLILLLHQQASAPLPYVRDVTSVKRGNRVTLVKIYNHYIFRLVNAVQNHPFYPLFPHMLRIMLPKALCPIFQSLCSFPISQAFISLIVLSLLSASVEAHDQLNLTTKMVDAVEKETQDQSRSKLWYRYRAGRVTALKMKAVCRMNSDQPSQSLIKSI